MVGPAGKPILIGSHPRISALACSCRVVICDPDDPDGAISPWEWLTRVSTWDYWQGSQTRFAPTHRKPVELATSRSLHSSMPSTLTATDAKSYRIGTKVPSHPPKTQSDITGDETEIIPNRPFIEECRIRSTREEGDSYKDSFGALEARWLSESYKEARLTNVSPNAVIARPTTLIAVKISQNPATRLTASIAASQNRLPYRSIKPISAISQ
jgi:hypothetical protein